MIPTKKGVGLRERGTEGPPRRRRLSARKRVAAILRRRAVEPTTSKPHSWELEEIAEEIEHCREPYQASGKRMKRDSCRLAWCPGCATWIFAKPNRQELQDIFAQVSHGDGHVYCVRLSLGQDRVPGGRLRDAVDRLNNCCRRLRQTKVWRQCVVFSCGVVHRRWKGESRKHGPAGFLPHLHLMLFCDRKPNFKAMGDGYRRILALPQETPLDDYLDLSEVDSVAGIATYLTHTKNHVPGYTTWRRKGDKRVRLDLERMPVADMFHFVESIGGTRRLLKHGTPRLATQARRYETKTNKERTRRARQEEEI